MSEQAIYVGSGIEKFNGNLIEISVCISDAESHIFEYNGKKYLKLVVSKKQHVDQFKKTHSVRINTWKPEQKKEDNCPSHEQRVDNEPINDLPF